VQDQEIADLKARLATLNSSIAAAMRGIQTEMHCSISGRRSERVKIVIVVLILSSSAKAHEI
jgi:hypothetical protein